MDTTLIAITALGAGLAGGGFLVFSTFVLQGLSAAGPEVAARAMQGINRRAVTPLFMLAIFGTALGAAALVVLFVLGRVDAGCLAAAVLYLAGAVLVTLVGNVPLNERLDAIAAPTAADWDRYRSRWLALNHVRTLSSATACGILLITLGA